MFDAFALFDLPRRPWLDAADLREDFHRRSASAHPDAGGDTDTFARLNTAYRTLHDPAARLRHFLELEAPEALARPAQIPPELTALFMQIGMHRNELGAFWKKEARASNPLTRALLVPEKMELQANATRLAATIAEYLSQTLDDVRKLGAIWMAEKPATPLAELLYALSFLGKWDHQLREDLLKLDL